jgi:hypothetical protein
MLTGYCDQGYPIMLRNREFTTDPSYELTWYQFTTVTYEDICKCERQCEAVVQEKKYRMSFLAMIGSSLPEFVRPLFSVLLPVYIGDTSKFVLQYEEGEPMFCASMITLVLNSVFPKLNIPPRSSSSDLLLLLKRAKMVSVMDHPPAFSKKNKKALEGPARHDYLVN